MDQNEHVMNLANSIIGVSILAMPYCFKECGIILSILLLFVSSVMSRLSCHFLLKSAILARRKTFEFLAFHAFGPFGKFFIEIGIIGFMLGTCIAFFVVMGDLGPEIFSEMTGSKKSNAMRTSILMALALFCVLPLGLLRKVDSLAGVSKATIGFYCCLVLKVVVESAPHFFSAEWLGRVDLWRPAGILQCLPIFSMALFCQTQLFEIYQAMPNPSLEKMNEIIRIATNICTFVYVFVGMFGYVAFYKTPFTGNILLSFRPSAVADVMKLGFVLSLAFSFPLVIFPCRASLYSLIYKRAVHEGSASTYIPEGKFKSLTFIIVFISLVIGVLIPNIELVLGLIGSTIGVMICVVFPVTCFICISPRNSNERLVAQLMLFIGIMVMVLGTYANLGAIEEIHMDPTEKLVMTRQDNQEAVVNVNNKPPPYHTENKLPQMNAVAKEIRREPPQPEEPLPPESAVSGNAFPQSDIMKPAAAAPPVQVHDGRQGAILPGSEHEEEKKAPPPSSGTAASSDKGRGKAADQVDVEAIKKEESELKEQDKAKEDKAEAKKQALLDTLEKQQQVQMQIVQQQQQLIEAIKQQQVVANEKQKEELNEVQQKKLEAVKQIESIAKQAIESLGVKETGNVPAEEKNAPVKLVPLPIAVLNNLTIDGKPRGQQVAQIPIEPTGKQNEINIKQVDNMHINIKHEINLNVDGRATPKNLVDLLNGKSDTINMEKKADGGSVATENTEVQKKVVPNENPEIAKRNSEVSSSPLSEPNLPLKDINIPNVQPAVGRDLKYLQAKM